MTSPPFRLLAIPPATGDVPIERLDSWLQCCQEPHVIAVLLRAPGEDVSARVGRLLPLARRAEALGIPRIASCDADDLPATLAAWAEAGVPLIGAQVRGDPPPAAVARSRAILGPRALLGVSVHGAPRTLPGAVDYACVAPIFRPASAPGKAPMGPGRLAAWCRGGVPVVALGGITAARAQAAVQAGARALAGISAFFGERRRVAQDVAALLAATTAISAPGPRATPTPRP